MKRSCYEEKLAEIIEARAQLVNDSQIAAFVTSAARQLQRSLYVGELSGLLGRFGPDCKKAFSDEVTNTTAHVAYDNLLANRHGTAHGSSATTMTFAEMAEAYSQSLAIVQAFAHALGVGGTEVFIEPSPT